MPVTRILWDGTANQDIHVLRGQTTRDLTRTLMFKDDGAGTDSVSAHSYFQHNHDVVLTFQPRSKGAAGAGGVFSGLDNDGETATGAGSPKNPPGRNNSIIQATVRTPPPAHK